MDTPLDLYFTAAPADVKTLELSRGDDDFRQTFIADDGQRKLVIKHLSNTFSDRRRIMGWFRLMEEYRQLGLYCPAVVPNLNGELLHCEERDGRDYYTYAEEYAAYETAEHIDKDKWTDENGHIRYVPDALRALGKVAAAHLNTVDWPSAYCLLEPFCAPDTVDEQTEAAEAFVSDIRRELPAHLPRAEALLALFYQRTEEVRAVYADLPTSCFQADLNDSNILLDDRQHFAGLIDFNLCGREPVLNYAIREALWNVSDKRLIGPNHSRLYLYDPALDDLHDRLFMKNMGYIQEAYAFSAQERAAFPVLFRYINSFWWFHKNELAQIKADDAKITQLLDWLEHQLTRDDLRLP